MLESFATPGVWKREDVEEILDDFGVVCVGRGGVGAEEVVARCIPPAVPGETWRVVAPSACIGGSRETAALIERK